MTDIYDNIDLFIVNLVYVNLFSLVFLFNIPFSYVSWVLWQNLSEGEGDCLRIV